MERMFVNLSQKRRDENVAISATKDYFVIFFTDVSFLCTYVSWQENKSVGVKIKWIALNLASFVNTKLNLR